MLGAHSFLSQPLIELWELGLPSWMIAHVGVGFSYGDGFGWMWGVNEVERDRFGRLWGLAGNGVGEVQCFKTRDRIKRSSIPSSYTFYLQLLLDIRSGVVKCFSQKLRGVWVKNGKNLLIISVYAPQELTEKKMLWDYLAFVIDNWKGEVVIMGDFNKVRKNERFGSVFKMHGENAFNSFISKVGLEEVPLGGCSFTWCHKSTTKMSKLDRFLISESLTSSCPNISAITLDRYLSDHRPILLRESQFDYGPIPFRVFHYWFEMEGFDKLVEDAWKGASVEESNTVVNMMKKLIYLKQKIREWNNDKKKSAQNCKTSFKKELAELDKAIDNGEANAQVVNKRMGVVKLLQDLEKLQSLEAAQKAKIKWPIEGDENSKYYHGILNKKMNQLTIRGILAEGTWIDDPLLVKRDFLVHFKTRFAKPDEPRIHLSMHFPNTLSSDQRAKMEINVSKEEIKKGGSNSSFIALILKIPDANMVKDYRPISLIGSLYKNIAKILANRLVNVLGDIVNEVQSDFVTDRQILDGPFILNELFQWCKSKKKQSLIFKVDFEKAYDSVRWDFLDDILKKFGFGDRWCGWIQSCLKSSRGSIIVNGMFRGIALGPALQLSHMFYADDEVFVGQWSHVNIDTIVNVLDCFHHASGMRINMNKSKLMRISVEEDKVAIAASKIGCLILKTPFSYLESKVGGLMSRIQSWNEVVDRVIAHLSKWKMKTLSIGGRLTLLKSILGSMPIYHMSIFKVPMRVLHRLESIRCHFFNGNDPHGNKLSWVKWKNVLASKEKEGLGVSSLYAVTKAIHGDDRKMGKNAKSAYPSIWLDIVHEMDLLKKQGIDVANCIKIKLGNGAKTSFWKDVWHGDTAFKYLYPRMYALESCKFVDVASKLSHVRFDFSFRCAPRGGAEQDQFIEMTSQVEGVVLSNMRDRWIWSLEGSGDFSVASVRKLIDDETLPEVAVKTRWIKAIPIKVNVHAWKVSLDCLPTKLNISRRGMDIDSIICPMCDNEVESTSHLFFTCHIAREIFRKISRWWDVSYTDIHSYEEWVTWIVNLRLSMKYKKVLEGVFYVMWWHIWAFCNKRIFGPKNSSMALIFDNVVSRSFYWCRSRSKASFSWIDWVKKPHLVSL
ncbi:RNA-directed DNA polymerase, eukaryota [Tanacetum coccineum]